MMMRRTLFGVGIFLVALPLFAYRREYLVTLNGERKAGSEVCFYRGEDASDPFALFFSASPVSCLSADKVLDFPPGLFHVFARHPDGFASKHRDYFVYRGEPAPEAGFEQLEIPLETGAVADLSAIVPNLKTGQSTGVWIAPAADSRGTYFPLVPGESTIRVPAGVPFVALLIESGRPVAFGDVMEPKPGDTLKIAPFAADKETGDLVAWVRLDSAVARTIDGPLTTPELVYVSGDRVFPPLFPLSSARGATHTLLFYRHVPRGHGELRIRGNTWMQTATDVTVAPGAATVVTEPVMLTPAAALRLTWNLGPAGAQTASICAAAPGVARPRIVTVLDDCTTASCRRVARRTAPLEPEGAMTLGGIRAGTYRVSIEVPMGKTAVIPVDLAAGKEQSISVPIDAFTFFGTVTLNGAPVSAHLVFESGEATSDTTGTYTAALGADPLRNLIRVSLCTEKRQFQYVPERPITRNTPYTIALNVVDLPVAVESETGAPVANAMVQYAPVKRIERDGPVIYYQSAAKATEADGKGKLADVPAGVPLIVCATHADYPDVCSDPITLKDAAPKEARLRFHPFPFHGTVAGHDGVGQVAWVDAVGRITEQVLLKPDGRFAFAKSHGSAEHMIYVSDRLPLAVLAIPSDWTGSTELALELPKARVRSFRVAVPDMKSDAGWIGLWIGGAYVPLNLLAFHLDNRGLDLQAHRGSDVVIRDITETAPISVAFAPRQQRPDFVDVFTLPEYAGVRRYRVAGDTIAIAP